ncbi:MAG: nuclear transport factor 2 family protein [Candidatus Accumulibacter sp.]|jgi:ketosteroid isomerase-like protein|nr:nuclear transport factor 2 family protein [Accumulibacter sp.]
MTPPFFTTPEDAEEAFYEAIARADIDALMATWSDDDEIVCIHPIGQRTDGQRGVRDGWYSIFENSPRFSVRARTRMRWESALVTVHCVTETLYQQQDSVVWGYMYSINVFVRGMYGWRLTLRHTSPTREQADFEDDDIYDGLQHTLH